MHDLGEALVAAALAEGGRVKVVAHANRLHGFRGGGRSSGRRWQRGSGCETALAHRSGRPASPEGRIR